jgi:hypothetical protein
MDLVDRMGHSNFQIKSWFYSKIPAERGTSSTARPDEQGSSSQPVCPHNHAYLCLNNSRYARQLKQSILNGAQLSYD